MSTAMIEDDLGLENITAEELIALRRIRARAQGHQYTDYRKALLSRISIKDPSKKPPLPGGKYQTYRLAGGIHERYDQKDIEECRQESKRLLESNGPATPPVTPNKHVFVPGDLITPETDAEALMMDQDQKKFRPVGPNNESSSVDELMAEIARLKQNQTKAEELEAREKALQAREEEVKKTTGRGNGRS